MKLLKQLFGVSINLLVVKNERYKVWNMIMNFPKVNQCIKRSLAIGIVRNGGGGLKGNRRGERGINIYTFTMY